MHACLAQHIWLSSLANSRIEMASRNSGIPVKKDNKHLIDHIYEQYLALETMIRRLSILPPPLLLKLSRYIKHVSVSAARTLLHQGNVTLNLIHNG